MRVLPPEIVLDYVGPLSRGKLRGIEVLLDAIEADESLTRMSDTNAAIAGGKRAGRYARHLHERVDRPDAIRNAPAETPLAAAAATSRRFSTPDEIKAFARAREFAERQRFGPARKP